MEKLSLLDALKLTSEYDKMPVKDRVQLRKKRLYDLVMYSKEHSAFYREHYANIPENFTINNLPLTTTADLMSDFNAWVTDDEASLEGAGAHLKEHATQDRLYLDRYYLVKSGGTDGADITMLLDENCGRLMSAGYIRRCFSDRSDYRRFIFSGARHVSMYSSGGAFFPNVFASMRKRYIPMRKKRSLLLQVQDSTSSLSSRIGAFRPSVIAGFPSALGRMADERSAGRLSINPMRIIADGEPLTDEMRSKLNSTFKCDVISSYSCAEGGCIAYECNHHHLHINDDWIILEPIDIEGHPVANNTPSDMVLLTNLMNYTTPVIRYALDDRIILHDDICECGNPSPWIEILGRSVDQAVFNDGIRSINIPMSELDAVFAQIPEVRRYQILIHPGNHISLRLSGSKGMDKTLAFFRTEKILRAYLKTIGIASPVITLERDDPQADSVSGKYRTVITM